MNTQPHNPIQNLHRQSLWPITLLALLLLLATAPGTAAVRASLDRDTIYSDDIFVLIIESEGQSSGQQPDLTPLEKDFEVLGTSTSTQVRIFNGRRSDKIQWHVQLQPRHQGQLIIPPINVDGQRTDAITLNISEAPPQPTTQVARHVFIESDIGTGDKPVYVQQQVPYTVRLYYDNHLQEGELSAPEVKNAIVERLGEDKRYRTMRNGHEYQVIERNYVISAEKSGDLSIPPARFQGRIAVQQRGRPSRSPMDELFANSPFASDPFFRNRLNSGLLSDPFARPGRPVSIHSSAIDITIKPRPATANDPWLPAEAITLSDSWTESPPHFMVGEPVTRTITIQVMGLSGSQIPELDITEPVNARIYPETPKQENRTDGKTIYGLRTRTLTYIPNAQGMLEIPPVTLDWWNTREDNPASSTLPAWQFNVLPSTPGSMNELLDELQTATPSPAGQAAITANTDDSKITQTNQRWLLGAGGVLFALTLLLIILFSRAKPQYPDTEPGDNPPKRTTALRDLQKACATHDRHATTRALLNLARSYWPDDPPHSLDALAARIKKGQAQLLLHELDRSLYAIDTADWNSSALWNEFKYGLPEKKTTEKHHNNGLNPLYSNGLKPS